MLHAIVPPEWAFCLMIVKWASMAIRIEIKKLTPWQHDLTDEIKVEMLNTIVEEYASEAAKQLAKMKCPTHPKKISHITIIADRQHTMIFRKQFCCPEFEKKISMKLLR